MIRRFLAFAGWAALAASAWGADDPGARALQQNLLQRQQQQDVLELRMQQQQRATQSPPAGSREQQAAKQLEIDQLQRQQERQYRQGVEPPAAQPADDEGARRAKAHMDMQEAGQQGQRQLRRFDFQSKQQADQWRKVESRGEITPIEPQ